MRLRLGLWDSLASRGLRVAHGPDRSGLDGGILRAVPDIRSRLGLRLPRLLGDVGRPRLEYVSRLHNLAAVRMGCVGLLLNSRGVLAATVEVKP